MNYHFLRVLLFISLSASALSQNPTDFDYEEDVPQQSGGQRSVPVFVNVHSHPKTGFSCADKNPGEYYADTENKCAVYYVCIPNERGGMSPQSFACPNGTLFSQSSRVCREHDQVYCPISTRYYDAVHGNIDSKGQEELYKPTPLQPWRHNSQPSRPRPQPSAQPQPQPQPQARPQSQPRPQTQTQPLSRPQASQPSRPIPQPVVSSPQNSRRSQFNPPSTTAAPPPPQPAAAPVEYEYEYIDYPQPNDTLQVRPPASVSPPVRTKRETSSRRKGQLPNPFEFLSSPHIITPFNCEDKVPGIAYADTQTDCKMFHVCIPFGKGKLKDYQLYCEANKALNQETGVCEPQDKVNCKRTLKFYVYNKWFRPQKSLKSSWKALMKKSIKS